MKRRKLNDLEKEKEKLEDELHKKRAELKIIVINECLSKFKDKIVQDADVIFTTLNSAVCSVMEENLANPRWVFCSFLLAFAYVKSLLIFLLSFSLFTLSPLSPTPELDSSNITSYK